MLRSSTFFYFLVNKNIALSFFFALHIGVDYQVTEEGPGAGVQAQERGKVSLHVCHGVHPDSGGNLPGEL